MHLKLQEKHLLSEELLSSALSRWYFADGGYPSLSIGSCQESISTELALGPNSQWYYSKRPCINETLSLLWPHLFTLILHIDADDDDNKDRDVLAGAQGKIIDFPLWTQHFWWFTTCRTYTPCTTTHSLSACPAGYAHGHTTWRFKVPIQQPICSHLWDFLHLLWTLVSHVSVTGLCPVLIFPDLVFKWICLENTVMHNVHSVLYSSPSIQFPPAFTSAQEVERLHLTAVSLGFRRLPASSTLSGLLPINDFPSWMR